jgi:hypothetical protein
MAVADGECSREAFCFCGVLCPINPPFALRLELSVGRPTLAPRAGIAIALPSVLLVLSSLACILSDFLNRKLLLFASRHYAKQQ